MDRLSADRLSGLIETLYDASVEDDWQAPISSLSATFDQVSVHLYGHDASLNRANIAITAGYSPEMLESYFKYYHSINAWLPQMMIQKPGVVRAAEEYLERRKLVRTEFYADWLLPQEELSAGGGVLLVEERDRYLVLGGAIREVDRDAKHGAWLRMLRLIAPHAARAMNFQRMLDGARLVGDGARAALDRLRRAVFALDAGGRLLFQNASGDRMLQGGEHLYRDASRTLRARETDADNAIAATVRAIVARRNGAALGLREAGAPIAGSNAFVLRRADGEAPVLAMMSPLGEAACAVRLASSLSSKRPTALLVVSSPDRGDPPSHDVLAALFATTPAESTLIQALCLGSTLSEYAAARRVTLNTARSQLKSIFAKTGARQQSQLVSIVSQLV